MLKRALFFLGIHLGKLIIQILFKLNKVRAVNSAVLDDAIAAGESAIICCWHGRLLFPFYFFRNRDYYALAGWHEDAEIISRVGEKMGWRMIRGSSTRGGQGAYQAIVDVLTEPGNMVALTPDGPRGPKQKLKPGAIKAAMRTAAVLIPVSGQASRRWEIVNWDTFVVPKPLGRIQFVFGPPLKVREGDGFEVVIHEMEDRLNKVQEQADAFTVNKT